MADAADVACVHMVGGLDPAGPDVEWSCLDCGRVFARLAGGATAVAGVLEVWAARVGVPDRLVARLLRRRADEAGEVAAAVPA